MRGTAGRPAILFWDFCKQCTCCSNVFVVLHGLRTPEHGTHMCVANISLIFILNQRHWKRPENTFTFIWACSIFELFTVDLHVSLKKRCLFRNKSYRDSLNENKLGLLRLFSLESNLSKQTPSLQETLRHAAQCLKEV